MEYDKKELDSRLKDELHHAGHRWRNRFHLSCRSASRAV